MIRLRLTFPESYESNVNHNWSSKQPPSKGYFGWLAVSLELATGISEEFSIGTKPFCVGASEVQTTERIKN